jgi:hypothetical protein
MIFDELAQLEELEIAEGALESEFNQTLMGLASQGFNLDNVKGGARAQKEIANNVAQQSAAQLMTRMTLDRMKDIATGDFEKAQKEAEKAAKKTEKEAAKAAKEEEKAEEPKEVEVPEEKGEEASE